MRQWAEGCFTKAGRKNALKLGLILIAAVIVSGLSFHIALQGKSIEGVTRTEGGLTLQKGGEALRVLALRHPNQSESFILSPADFVTQIEGIKTYKALDAYLARQGDISRILEARSIFMTVKAADGRTFETQSRVTSLPVQSFAEGFWIAMIVGLLAFLVGASVWTLKPDEPATRTLAVNGFSMLLAAVSSSAAFSEPVAVDPLIASIGLGVNHVATVIFGSTLLGLFLHFPTRLVSARTYSYVMASGLAIFLLDQFRLLGSPSGMMVYCLAVLIGVLIILIIQFRATRSSARSRAALLWLGLSVLVGAGSWGVTVLLYLIQGQYHLMPESFLFLSFLLLYCGIAIGVARFRLFEVADWAFRIFFFGVAAVLFLLLDALLIYGVRLAPSSSVGLALLAVAFGYLPLRDLLWRRFVHTRTLSESEMMSSVLDMAFAADPLQRNERWHALVNRLFTPTAITLTSDGAACPQIEEDGLFLDLPAFLDIPALRLANPRSGRGLFGPRDVELIDQIIRLSNKAADGLNAYERGAAEQRVKLAKDLHDTVSGKLISGLGVADEAARPFIHGALDDIRDIASTLGSNNVPIDHIMADIRHEAARRCEAAHLGLDWPVWPDDLPFITLSALQNKALSASVREIVTNIIKHAQATRVVVRHSVSSTHLNLAVWDNGLGFPTSVLEGVWNGQGLKSVCERLTQVNGRVQFTNANMGASVEIDLPLKALVPERER